MTNKYNWFDMLRVENGMIQEYWDTARKNPPSLKSMSIDLSEEYLSRLVAPIEHYDAYLRSQKREDGAYRDLTE